MLHSVAQRDRFESRLAPLNVIIIDVDMVLIAAMLISDQLIPPSPPLLLLLYYRVGLFFNLFSKK